MTENDQNQLLRELLPGEETSDFRRVSLEKGLASIRLQRKRRQLARVFGLFFLMALFPAAILFIERSNRYPSEKSVKMQHNVASFRTDEGLETKFITDEDLFRLFPGRSMALIGKPGEQELVFLSKPRPQDSSGVH
jgi:hypothetical protein